MGDTIIEAVKDNKDKEHAYQEQMGRYKKAMDNEFYFEALLIVYATIEDRLRSFLCHTGALRKTEDEKLNIGKTKSVLRCLYFGSEEAAKNKRLDINNISVKEDLIRKMLNWANEYAGIPEDTYLAILKSELLGCVDIGGLLETLDAIDEWRKYRNEIIHGLMNKKPSSVNEELRIRVEDGMKYARFIHSQVKALSKNDVIRTKMKIRK